MPKLCRGCNLEKQDSEWGKNTFRCSECLREYGRRKYRELVPKPRQYPVIEKICPGCGNLKSRDEFGEKAQLEGGLAIRDLCLICATKSASKWRLEHIEHNRATKREIYRRNPEPHKLAAAEWGNTDRGKIVRKIQMRTRRAIERGQLIRSDVCEFCGLKCITQAAHEDYSRPLDVKWLCRPCHAQWDHDYPKSLNVVELGL